MGALSLLGAIEHSRDNLPAAVPIYERAIDLAERSGRPFERALILNNLASITFTHLGDLPRGEQLYLEAVEDARSIDATEIVAFGLIGLTRIAHATGDEELSGAYGRESLDLFARLGFRDRMATSCVYLADVAEANADAELGARLLGAADGLRAGTGATPDSYEQDVEDAVRASLLARLGSDRFESEFATGSAEPERVVDEARAVSA